MAEHHGGVVAGGESQHLLEVARACREQAAVGADDLNTGGQLFRIFTDLDNLASLPRDSDIDIQSFLSMTQKHL